MHSLDLSYLKRYEIAKLNKPKPKPTASQGKINNDSIIIGASEISPTNAEMPKAKNADKSDYSTAQKYPSTKIDLDVEKKDIQNMIEVEQERKRLAEIELEITKLREEQRIAQVNTQYNDVQRNQALKDQMAADKASRMWQWIKRILIVLFFLLLFILISLMLFRLYRWTVETPIIKEVIRKVEVPVEKRVEVPVEKLVEVEVPVEKIVEKEVVPEECSQVRRNGKIYMNCDGQSINGTPTLGDTKINEIPELLD